MKTLYVPKELWEKKMLVSSIFFLSYNIFYPI